MEVSFSGLTYETKGFNKYIKFGGTKKTILKSINGQFHPGELSGILGPSGAGKTTLLHILSGYRTGGIQGELLVNGNQRNEKKFRCISRYITQEDMLPSCITVNEIMMTAARLKLSRFIDIPTKQRTVDEILTQLGLEHTHHTKVERLSGGQRKRLSIALELLDNPPVFFLDEPTSGLDNVTAKQTILLLKRLASEGRTIVVTIHQPSATLLKLFHKIYFVAAGKCVYQGTPDNLISFLKDAGFDCPVSYNPADYIIELVDYNKENNTIYTFSNAIENGLKSEDTLQQTNEEINHQKNEDRLSRKRSTLQDFSWMKMKEIPKDGKINFANPEWYQFLVLLKRLFKQTIRNKKALGLQTFHYIFSALLLGFVFYDNGNDGAMMFNHLKFILGMTMFFSNTRLFIPLILYPSEVKIIKKEHFNRWYGLTPYYLAMMIADFPIHFLFNLTYAILVYYLSSLPRDLWRFAAYLLIGNIIAFGTEGIGIAIGSVFNELNGSVLGPMIVVPFLGLAIYGFDFAKEISPFMKVVMLTSPMRSGLVAFLFIIFGFGRKPLQCDDIYCHFADPNVLLDYLDGSITQLIIDCIALVGNTIFYRVLAYFCLRQRFSP